MAEKKKKKKPIEVLDKDDLKGRQKALKSAIDEIIKQYGAGAVMKLGELTTQDVEVIPTGSLSLDVALGVGGLPRGRIVEIYGPESSGKTTLTLHIIAEVQKLGGETAFIDVEHALDPVYAHKLGVDVDKLIVSQPDSGEEALEITEKLVRSSAVDLVVVDSVAALVTKAEIEGTMGDPHVGLQARLMSQALRKLTSIMNKTNTTVIFINQLREKVGMSYGNPETTPGGRALKFYSSVRLDVRKGESITESGNKIGNKTKVKVVKNKVAPPFKVAEFDMIYGKGISSFMNIVDLAIEFEIVKKAGSWFSYGETKIGQGRDKVVDFIKADEKIKEEIETLVKQKAKEITSYGAMTEEDDDDTPSDDNDSADE